MWNNDCDAVRLKIYNQRIADNLTYLRDNTKSSIIAVVKDNGYGMGLIPYTRMLYELDIRQVAVSSFAEAKQLLDTGLDIQIQMLTPLTCQEHIQLLADAGVILMLGNPLQSRAVCEALSGTRKSYCVQVKLDTGLGRYGFHPNELFQLKLLPERIKIVGTYTHFADAYHSRQRTADQFQRFTSMVEDMREQGISPGTLHACASGAFLKYPHMHLDAVRLGSAIIGAVPDTIESGLKPIWQMEAPIVSVCRSMYDGVVGYGKGIMLRSGTRWGVLPVGYADGLQTPEKGRQWLKYCRGLFLSRGKYQAVNSSGIVSEKGIIPLGRMGANHVLVDLTESQLDQGDWVTLKVNPLRLPSCLMREYL